MLDLAVDAIVSIDEDQTIIGFNKGAESLFGYLAEEVLGKPLDILLPERSVMAHRDHVRTSEELLTGELLPALRG